MQTNCVCPPPRTNLKIAETRVLTELGRVRNGVIETGADTVRDAGVREPPRVTPDGASHARLQNKYYCVCFSYVIHLFVYSIICRFNDEKVHFLQTVHVINFLEGFILNPRVHTLFK